MPTPYEWILSVKYRINSIKPGLVKEVFGTGTAATIAHIELIGYNGKDYYLPALANFSTPVWMDSKIVITALLFLALGYTGAAQPALALVKREWTVTHYSEGEYIRFKRKDRDHYTAGLIGGLNKDYFRIGEDTTYLHQLERIDIHEKVPAGLNAKTVGATLMLAGAVFFLGDLFNETVISKESYSPNSGVLIASAGLVVTGVALQFVKTGNYKLGRRKKMVVIER